MAHADSTPAPRKKRVTKAAAKNRAQAQADQELIARAKVTLPKNAKVTPMFRQWLEAKAKAPDAILLFRMGDFYELFASDAEIAAPVLEIAVTSRDKGKEDKVPMAGFPHHAAAGYIARLVAEGFKVAVCDQLETPAMAKGIVKRGITRVVTPGMVLDQDALDARANNFLAAVTASKDGTQFGLAALDVSTGEFVVTCAPSGAVLRDEIARLAPSEVVVQPGALDDALLGYLRGGKRRVEERDAPVKARATLKRLGPVDTMLADPSLTPALDAAELACGYVEEMQTKLPTHLRPPRPYAVARQLLLDETTRRHLDIVGPPKARRRVGTLAGVVDVTCTAMGGRRLSRMLLSPSTDMDTIGERLDVVQSLVAEPALRDGLRDELRAVYDLERLTARAASGRCSPRDLGQLARSLRALPDAFAPLLESDAAAAARRVASIDVLPELTAHLSTALVDEPPLLLKEGGIFRAGFDEELDEMVALSSGGRDRLAGIEAREREALGIPNLKVKYTRVFGYYIEVTRAHLHKVPAHYRRKQTVATGERYVTEELADLESKLATADMHKSAREADLFEALRAEVATHAHRLLDTAGRVAELDALAAFAAVSDARRFVRPTLVPADERRLDIRAGRHPVVEALSEKLGEPYVPNCVALSGDDRQVLLVTGPNMSGKSTVMRQTALIQLLAQAGCFVPADEATLSICDRIFTRVGASDDLSQGRSTFMVEMSETGHILHNATPYSLVLLDEIGRGTSTFDGLSLAWAVAEHLHDNVGARTMFATHYHELTQLGADLPRVANVHVAVKESGTDVVFLRSLVDGAAERSYGIHVARLAGLPAGVLARAREVLAHLEGEDTPDEAPDAADPSAPPAAPRPKPAKVRAAKRRLPQMDLFGAGKPAEDTAADAAPEAGGVDPAAFAGHEALVQALLDIDVNRTSPIAALNALDALVAQARRVRRG